MRDKILILHGWGGSDYPHWQSWLAGKLASEYGTVSFPLLDNPHFPSKNRWCKQAKAIIEEFTPTIVIAHSLGAVLWLWLADEIETKPTQIILVAPPSQTTSIETIKSFFPYPTPDLSPQESTIIVSNDDPYITPDEAKYLGQQIGAYVEILAEMGHINTDSGFGPWEYIYERIEKHKRADYDS